MIHQHPLLLFCIGFIMDMVYKGSRMVQRFVDGLIGFI